MGRFYQAVLNLAVATLAATVVLSFANQCWSQQTTPNDDPADVALLRKSLPGALGVDAQGNVVRVFIDQRDPLKDPEVISALHRLRHVRSFTSDLFPDPYLVGFIKEWRALESITLMDQVSDQDLVAFGSLNCLKNLQISSGRVTDKGVKSIAQLKGLERLGLSEGPLTDRCIDDIATLPALEWLALTGNAITDAGVARLKGMKLKSLGLDSTKITNQCIDAIKDMPSLERLDVCNTKVTSSALEKLKQRKPRLEVHTLPKNDVREIADDPAAQAALAVARISAPKDNVTDNIHDIDATGGARTNRTWIKYLPGLRSVQRLTLASYETTDDDLKYVRDMKTLTSLDVCGGSFGDQGMESIGKLTSLTKLAIRSCAGLTSQTSRHLKGLASLETLDLSGSAIGDDGLRYLSGMKKLMKLRLDYTKITDDGLANLHGLPKLDELSLTRTAVTGAGLENLRDLKSLTSVFGIRRDAVIKLKKYLPNLVVPKHDLGK